MDRVEGAGKKAGRKARRREEEREGRKVKGELSLREYWESIGKCRRYD